MGATLGGWVGWFPVINIVASNMWETAALVKLLERKGILTKQEVLAMIQELRQREPTAIPPRGVSSQ